MSMTVEACVGRQGGWGNATDRSRNFLQEHAKVPLAARIGIDDTHKCGKDTSSQEDCANAAADAAGPSLAHFEAGGSWPR